MSSISGGVVMELTQDFKDKFVVTLQGKEFILYGGVLHLAKSRGLKRIETNVIQIPSQENSMYAVVEATVETDDGVFSEVGDASPESVNRMIKPHLLRMAATRAKARAMRDAVGIDMVAVEELGDTPSDSLDSYRPDAIPPSGEYILDFGKYKGKTIPEVLEADPGYVQWLAENAKDQQIRKLAMEVLTAPVESEGDFDILPEMTYIDFGKYKGTTLGEIEAKDSGYVDWLANNAKNNEVRISAQAIVASRTRGDNIVDNTLPLDMPKNVTQAQLKRLYAIASTNKVSDAEVKGYIEKKHGCSSTKELSRHQYEDVVEWLEQQGFKATDDAWEHRWDGLLEQAETFADVAGDEPF